MKNRILSLLLVFILAASLLPCAAFAEGEGAGTVSGSATITAPEECYPGDEITVTVSVTSDPGIYAMFADLNYGSDVEFVSVSASGGGYFRNEEEGSSNPDAIIWVGAPVTVESNGDISITVSDLAAYESLTLTYKFKVKDSASVGSPLSFTADLDAGTLTGTGDEVTETGVEIAQASASVTVEAKPYTLGDVNDDGKVNARDAAMTANFVASIVTLTETQQLAADVNKDERINARDAALIANFAAGLITSWS